MPHQVLVRLNPSRLSELTEDGSRAILSVATSSSATSTAHINTQPNKDSARDQLLSKLLYSVASIAVEATLDGHTLLSNLEYSDPSSPLAARVGNTILSRFDNCAKSNPKSDTTNQYADEEAPTTRFVEDATDVYPVCRAELLFSNTQVTLHDAGGAGDRVQTFVFPFTQGHQILSVSRPISSAEQRTTSNHRCLSARLDAAFGRVLASSVMNAIFDEVILANDVLSPLPPVGMIRRYVGDTAEDDWTLLTRAIQERPTAIGEASIEQISTLLLTAVQTPPLSTNLTTASSSLTSPTFFHRIMEKVFMSDEGVDRSANVSDCTWDVSTVHDALRRTALLSGASPFTARSDTRQSFHHIYHTPCHADIFNNAGVDCGGNSTRESSHTPALAREGDVEEDVGDEVRNQHVPPVIRELIQKAALTELMNVRGFVCDGVACWSHDGDLLVNSFGARSQAAPSHEQRRQISSSFSHFKDGRVIFATKIIPQVCDTIAAIGVSDILRNLAVAQSSSSHHATSRMRYRLVRLSTNPAHRNQGANVSEYTQLTGACKSQQERNSVTGERFTREQGEYVLTAVDASCGTCIALGLVFDPSPKSSRRLRQPTLTGILAKVSEWLAAEHTRLRAGVLADAQLAHQGAMAAGSLRAAVDGSGSNLPYYFGPLTSTPSSLLAVSPAAAIRNAAEELRDLAATMHSSLRNIVVAASNARVARHAHVAAVAWLVGRGAVSNPLPRLHPGSGVLSQLFSCCGIVSVVIATFGGVTSKMPLGPLNMVLRRDADFFTLVSLVNRFKHATTCKSTKRPTSRASSLLLDAEVRQVGSKVAREVATAKIESEMLKVLPLTGGSWFSSESTPVVGSSLLGGSPSLISTMLRGLGASSALRGAARPSSGRHAPISPALIKTTTMASFRVPSTLDNGACDVMSGQLCALVGFTRLHTNGTITDGLLAPLPSAYQHQIAQELLRCGA